MKISIAKRGQYSLGVDQMKNRIYYTMTGFWRNPEDFPEYFNDWNRAIAEMSPGFTILTDVREFKTPAPVIKPMFDKIQRILGESGLKKTAELFGKDVVAEMSLDSVAKRSGMQKANFNDLAQAEAWLDEG